MTRAFGRALSLSALVALGAGPAGAQEQVFRTADVPPGKQVRLGVYGNVSKECTVGPMPEIKVATPPKHGQLAIRNMKTKPGTLKRCASLEVPIQNVFYQAPAKYNGPDEVAYEVKQADGRVRVLTVKINVSDKAKPDAKPEAKSEGADL